MHRIVVIGRGLIGSAAARHLAESTDGIAVVGPDEPTSRAQHDGVFASHYDEGRMTRHVDPEPEWAITAARAIARYRDLEARSEVSFFTPSGFLGIGCPGSDYIARSAENGAALGAPIERLDAAAIRARYPFLAVEDTADGLAETGNAGHISPRRLVEAQARLAEHAGATVIRQAARAVRATASGVEIELWDGALLHAERALIATGAFTEAMGFTADLGLTVYGRTTVLVRIEGAAKETLAAMPTLIDAAPDAYILPPILYPDGRHYLKIGIGSEADPTFKTLSPLQDWFKSAGSPENRAAYKAHVTSLIPVLQDCPHWHTDTCAVTWTRSGFPIIDYALDDRIAVAVGGNGKGAKGSDEWGRIAAGLVSGAPWSSEVPREKLALPG